MPAPQQSTVPVYKETANIPRPNVAYYTHSKRDSAGYALADLLKVATKRAAKRYNENKAELEAQDEQTQVAHAQLGMENINRATSQGTFDLITGDFDLNSYDMKQGQLAAADYAGSLRDAYMGEEVYNITDPKEFNRWLQGKITDQIAAAKAKGPSYYNGFVRELGGNVELLTKQYAGHTQEVIASRSADAYRNKLKLAAEADAAVSKATELGVWLKGFLHSESGGNWNAWFGNAGNREDLSQLTLGEILRRQGEPGNDAAGLIQIVPGTLKGMMKKYGYREDMRFTPQVQTEMALFLMKEKGLGKWLNGEISDGVFADRLASVWAGLKTSGGRGVYDGDGVNKGQQDHSVTVAQLGQLRYLMDRNPALKKLMMSDEIKAGATELVLGGKSNTNVATLLGDDAGTGVSNVKGRDLYADMLVESIIRDSGTPIDIESIEADMDVLKLNKDQRNRVRQAVEQRQKRDEIAARDTRSKRFSSAIDAVTSGDPAKLDELRDADPDFYQAILTRMHDEDGPDIDETTDEFLKDLDYGQKNVTEKALRAYLAGEISKEGLSEAVAQSKLHRTYTGIVKTPAIRSYLDSVKRTLPVGAEGTFDQLLTAALNDLIDQNEGRRPPVATIIETVDQMAQMATQRIEAERQSIMDKYKT